MTLAEAKAVLKVIPKNSEEIKQYKAALVIVMKAAMNWMR